MAQLTQTNMQPIVAAIDASVLAAEIAALPREQILVQTGEYIAAYARAPQIPNLLAEIGRLREIAYRDAGEGTGKSADIDSFDYDYLQLFIWSKKSHQIIGGYRLGLTDELLAAKGKAGLYTSTLFEYSDEALRRIDPAMELGRSFVIPAQQKAYAPLLLLWKGIGQFILRHPRYKRLFGPVSISNTYSLISKQLMVRFLRVHHGLASAKRWVTPKNPFRESRVRGFDDDAIRVLLRDGDEVSTFVSEIEADHKGIPVLLRQYLKFGAHLLALNVDPDFSDVLDGLLMADLTKTDRQVLERYMGKEGVAQFLKSHNV